MPDRKPIKDLDNFVSDGSPMKHVEVSDEAYQSSMGLRPDTLVSYVSPIITIFS